jgi:hypothetical protein
MAAWLQPKSSAACLTVKSGSIGFHRLRNCSRASESHAVRGTPTFRAAHNANDHSHIRACCPVRPRVFSHFVLPAAALNSRPRHSKRQAGHHMRQQEDRESNLKRSHASSFKTIPSGEPSKKALNWFGAIRVRICRKIVGEVFLLPPHL